MNLVFLSTAEDFRAWLEKNHATVPELWIGFHKTATKRPGLRYAEALDQALCYGWIDGVRKRLDDKRFTIRFTPRKPKSRWSQVNIGKVQALIKSGLMRPPGLAAFSARQPTESAGYSYETRPRTLPAAYSRPFRTHPKAWAFFQAQPPWYQRTASWWVVSAKKEETRQRRLLALIDLSARSRYIAELERWG